MGNVVPMDSKLLSNYWYITCPGHHGQLISQNCVLTKIGAERQLYKAYISCSMKDLERT